jgi:hypothetical protein
VVWGIEGGESRAGEVLLSRRGHRRLRAPRRDAVPTLGPLPRPPSRLRTKRQDAASTAWRGEESRAGNRGRARFCCRDAATAACARHGGTPCPHLAPLPFRPPSRLRTKRQDAASTAWRGEESRAGRKCRVATASCRGVGNRGRGIEGRARFCCRDAGTAACARHGGTPCPHLAPRPSSPVPVTHKAAGCRFYSLVERGIEGGESRAGEVLLSRRGHRRLRAPRRDAVPTLGPAALPSPVPVTHKAAGCRFYSLVERGIEGGESRAGEVLLSRRGAPQLARATAGRRAHTWPRCPSVAPSRLRTKRQDAASTAWRGGESRAGNRGRGARAEWPRHLAVVWGIEGGESRAGEVFLSRRGHRRLRAPRRDAVPTLGPPSLVPRPGYAQSGRMPLLQLGGAGNRGRGIEAGRGFAAETRAPPLARATAGRRAHTWPPVPRPPSRLRTKRQDAASTAWRGGESRAGNRGRGEVLLPRRGHRRLRAPRRDAVPTLGPPSLVPRPGYAQSGRMPLLQLGGAGNLGRGIEGGRGFAVETRPPPLARATAGRRAHTWPRCPSVAPSRLRTKRQDAASTAWRGGESRAGNRGRGEVLLPRRGHRRLRAPRRDAVPTLGPPSLVPRPGYAQSGRMPLLQLGGAGNLGRGIEGGRGFAVETRPPPLARATAGRRAHTWPRCPSVAPSRLRTKRQDAASTAWRGGESRAGNRGRGIEGGESRAGGGFAVETRAPPLARATAGRRAHTWPRCPSVPRPGYAQSGRMPLLQLGGAGNRGRGIGGGESRAGNRGRARFCCRDAGTAACARHGGTPCPHLAPLPVPRSPSRLRTKRQDAASTAWWSGESRAGNRGPGEVLLPRRGHRRLRAPRRDAVPTLGPAALPSPVPVTHKAAGCRFYSLVERGIEGGESRAGEVLLSRRGAPQLARATAGRRAHTWPRCPSVAPSRLRTKRQDAASTAWRGGESRAGNRGRGARAEWPRHLAVVWGIEGGESRAGEVLLSRRGHRRLRAPRRDAVPTLGPPSLVPRPGYAQSGRMPLLQLGGAGGIGGGESRAGRFCCRDAGTAACARHGGTPCPHLAPPPFRPLRLLKLRAPGHANALTS